VSGGTRFSIPFADFFKVKIGANASYFSDTIVTSTNSTVLQMSFPGVTLVNFGPSNFNASTGLNWYWTQPITDALANGDKPVTGFKFNPANNIDFSADGPFGFLTGVAISTYPTVKITVTGSNYKSIYQTFSQSVDTTLTFLGIPLVGANESTYNSNQEVNDQTQTVTITLNPPIDAVGQSNVQSRGWILGGQTLYPAESAQYKSYRAFSRLNLASHAPAPAAHQEGQAHHAHHGHHGHGHGHGHAHQEKDAHHEKH